MRRRAAASAMWTGPALLVPTTVEALPITNNSYSQLWSWTTPSYPSLRTFARVDTQPFTAQPPTMPGVTKFRGVVVRWALPDGVTKGTQSGAGVSFPAAPNRWLVVRRQPKGTEWRYSAWIIASDYLSGPAGSPWPNPQGTGGTTLGACWPIADWPGEAEVSKHAMDPPLTAAGPGDPTFAAFAPRVVNVFAFADQLDNTVAGPLGYSVTGWYSTPRLDPLYGWDAYGPDGWQTVDQWHSLLSDMRWSVGNDRDEADAVQAARDWARDHGHPSGPSPHLTHPARTLCHGFVAEVPWQGVDGPALSGAPTANPQWPSYVEPRVVVAHSAIDALTAVIVKAEEDAGMPPEKAEQLASILEAFNLDALPLLDERDGLAQLSLAIQENWFDTAAGGTNWELTLPRDSDAPTGSKRPATLDGDQQRLLTALNLAQADLDQTGRLLAARQWERYGLWWKGNRLKYLIPPPPQQWIDQLNAAIPPLDTGIGGLANRYRLARQQRDQALVALHASLGELTLVAGGQPPFHRPSQPTVLINGAGRSFTHGEDGRFAADGTVRCRFTGQTVWGIGLGVAGQLVTVTGKDIPPPDWKCADLPWEAPDLAVEAFFLDLTSAPLIAATASPSQPWDLLAEIRKEQSAPWNALLYSPIDPATIAVQTGLISEYGLGALPSKLSVGYFTPPWSPLYLDWQFDFYAGSADQSRALVNWQLPLGDDTSQPLDEFSYRWRGGAVPRGHPIGMQGRTFLTPQVTQVFAAKLERLIDDGADAPSVQQRLWALQDALLYVRNADLLSQAATGFGDNLIERGISLFRVPADQSLDSLLQSPGVPPYSPDTTPLPPAPPPPPPKPGPPNPFSALAAGHMKLTRLWVVDSFGQVFDVLGAQPPGTNPTPGIDMVTKGQADLAELKPRMAQFARLRMPWLDASDDLAEVTTVTGANPVCGWLIPSNIDHGILVYTAAGDLEGELLLGSDRALWVPAPEKSPPPHGGSPPVTIGNPHLRNVVTGVLDHRTDGIPDSFAALGALLKLLDTAFWAINPSGGWADEELPVLIGRPLAVVRARLRLEVSGDLAYDQSWPDTGENISNGYETVPFPVQLGCTELLDDGLVGFYRNDDYRAINTVYSLPRADGGAIGDTAAAGYVAHDRPEVQLAAGSSVVLTLVLDPRCTVHAISAVLPAVRATLPVEFTTPALSTMAAIFRTGPVLSEPGLARMPLPALREGAWSWLQYATTTQPATLAPVLASDATATLPSAAPLLREGWLNLLLEGRSTLSYALDPPAVATSTDPVAPDVAMFRLTAYNGTGTPVACSQLDISIPIGSGAAELTASPELITVTVSGDGTWQVSGGGNGHFTATPANGEPLGKGVTLTFLITGVVINTEAGTSAVTVTEVTGQTRRSLLPVTKVTGSRLPEPTSARSGAANELPAGAVQLRGHAQRGPLQCEREGHVSRDADAGSHQPDH